MGTFPRPESRRIAPTEIRPGLRAPARAAPRPSTGVSLWWCGLEAHAGELALIARTLSAAEIARAARFGTDALRHRWMAGRAALREVLAVTLGVAPSEVAMRRGVRGRPGARRSSARIDFNVSHTRDVALMAIAHDGAPATRIGVDIEHTSARSASTCWRRNSSRRASASGSPDFHPTCAGGSSCIYWTCKEAMSKATGDGIIAPFGQLEVELGDSPRLLAGPPPYVPGDWSLVAPRFRPNGLRPSRSGIERAETAPRARVTARTRVLPARLSRAWAASVRSGSSVFGYFHRFCSHSQSAGLSRTAASSICAKRSMIGVSSSVSNGGIASGCRRTE
jgi:4'-phosphopantetheinyl transferase